MAAVGGAGLPATSGVPPGGGGDGRDQRAGAGDQPAGDRIGGVEVGGDEARAGPHRGRRAVEAVEVELPVEADDHRVGRAVVDGDHADVGERLDARPGRRTRARGRRRGSVSARS